MPHQALHLEPAGLRGPCGRGLPGEASAEMGTHLGVPPEHTTVCRGDKLKDAAAWTLGPTRSETGTQWRGRGRGQQSHISEQLEGLGGGLQERDQRGVAHGRGGVPQELHDLVRG